MKAGVCEVALCLALCLTTNTLLVSAMDHGDDHGDGAGMSLEPCMYEGYYPLYLSHTAAAAASPTNGSHQPAFGTFFMPNGSDPMYHGNAPPEVDAPNCMNYTVPCTVRTPSAPSCVHCATFGGCLLETSHSRPCSKVGPALLCRACRENDSL